MFSEMVKRFAIIFIRAFEARLKIYYSTFRSLRHCLKPSCKQLVVTIGSLSLLKRNEQLQGGIPLWDLLRHHCTTTPCESKLIELEPHSPWSNATIDEPMAYVYTAAPLPIFFIFSHLKTICDESIRRIQLVGPNNQKTIVSNYSRSHVVGKQTVMLLP